MALKDWKRKNLENGREHFVFINKNGRRIYVAKQINGNKWYVDFEWLNGYKLFNTESQALRFAKHYMRSH